MNDALVHYGVKGMKWGVRRYRKDDGTSSSAGKRRQSRQERKEEKAARKKLDKFEKEFSKDAVSRSALVNLAARSVIKPEDYEKAIRLMERGQLIVDAQFKKNYEKRSIDLYVGGSPSPTMRIRAEKGKEFSAKFLDDVNTMNYNKFVEYYNNRGKS